MFYITLFLLLSLLASIYLEKACSSDFRKYSNISEQNSSFNSISFGFEDIQLTGTTNNPAMFELFIPVY
jgi:hypothetical protein